MANHYIRIDESNIVIYGFSDEFEQPLETDILLMENGPRLFQDAFPNPLKSDREQFLYKWDGEQMVERTQQELSDEWSEQPAAPPSIEDRLSATEELLLTMMLGG